MNFTTPKLCSLLHQILDVLVVQDIAWDVDGLAAALVDLIGYRLALLYATQSVPASTPLASFSSSSPSPPPPLPPSPRIDVSCLPLTAIDIGYNDVGTLVRKQSRCFSSNALPGACDDGSLAGKHATGVVELRRHGEDGRVCNMQESSMKEEMYVWEREIVTYIAAYNGTYISMACFGTLGSCHRQIMSENRGQRSYEQGRTICLGMFHDTT